MDKREKIEYSTTCLRNPEYPKTQLICGQIVRVKDKNTPIEVLTPRGDRQLLAYLKD